MKKSLSVRAFILLLAVFPLVVAGCSASNGDSLSLESVKWNAESLNGVKLSLSKSITIEFNKQTLTVGGFAGCNTYFGSYSTRQTKIAIIGLGSTDMYCDNMKTETDYLAALKSADSYKISGTKLTLYSGSTAVVVFKKSAE